MFEAVENQTKGNNVGVGHIQKITCAPVVVEAQCEISVAGGF